MVQQEKSESYLSDVHGIHNRTLCTNACELREDRKQEEGKKKNEKVGKQRRWKLIIQRE